MGGAGTSPPPRRPAATRGAVGARGAYVTCQVSIQVCFEIYSRFETQMFVSSGEVRDLILESLGGHDKHGTGSRCTLQKQCRPPSPSSHGETSAVVCSLAP